MEQAVLIVSCC